MYVDQITLKNIGLQSKHLHPLNLVHQFLHRGTKNIKVELSSDNSDYHTVLTETLVNRAGTECTAPIETYDICGVGRYLRVTMVDYHGRGAGLHYFNVLHHNKKTEG